MLKKKLMALAILSVATGSVSLAHADDDGTINFTGTISASACSVSSVAGSGSTHGTVRFGYVSSANMAAAGNTTASVPFTIELSHCAVSTAPSITFMGTPVTVNGYTSLFNSDVPGVGIRIEDRGRTGTFYTPNVSATNSGFNALTSTTVTSATGVFNAYLVAYSDVATGETRAGVIDTDVTFVIDYADS